jgi:hypothetical protein
MKTSLKSMVTAMLLIGTLLSLDAQQQSQQMTPELKTQLEGFDFWIGEWDVYIYNTDTLIGRSSIKSILQGTAIQEYYESTQYNYQGTSLNKYNLREQRWEQYWIDVSGLTLHIAGGVEDGKMIMSNVMDTQQGPIENRITWYRDTPITVRQMWDQKKPDDAEWQTIYDGSYRVHSDDR